ncbi:MAG: hypothetical protein KGR26_12305, partial [Cyanobacteria bacterium REEB65]|nr:hypothetical protein [Cyanobacteria bacterium REEB65]
MRQRPSVLLTKAILRLAEALLWRGSSSAYRAKNLAEEALERSSSGEFANPSDAVAALRVKGLAALAEKDVTNSAMLLREAVSQADAGGNPLESARCWLARSRLFVTLGKVKYAQECLDRSRQAFGEIENRKGLAAVEEQERRKTRGKESTEIGDSGKTKSAAGSSQEGKRMLLDEASELAARTILPAADVPTILEALCRVAVQALGGIRAFCYPTEGGQVFLFPPQDSGADLVDAFTFTERVRSSGCGRFEERGGPDDREPRSRIGALLKGAKGVWGIVAVEGPVGWFHAEDLRMLEHLAQYGELALDSQNLEHRIAENRENMRALEKLGQAAGVPTGADRMLARFIRLAAEETGAQRGWILQGTTLVLAGAGPDGHEDLDGSAVAVELIVEAQQARKPIVRQTADREWVLVAPLAGPFENLGVIYLLRVGSPFSPTSEAWLEAMCYGAASILVAGLHLETQRRKMGEIESAIRIHESGYSLSITDGTTGLYTRD